jgi:hypothetical protein
VANFGFKFRFILEGLGFEVLSQSLRLLPVVSHNSEFALGFGELGTQLGLRVMGRNLAKLCLLELGLQLV